MAADEGTHSSIDVNVNIRDEGGGSGSGSPTAATPPPDVDPSQGAATARASEAAIDRTIAASGNAGVPTGGSPPGAARDASGQFYHSMAMAGAFSQVMGGNSAGGVQGLLQNAMMQPFYEQHRRDQMHAELAATNGRAAADREFGTPGFGAGFLWRNKKRLAMAGGGLLALKGIQMSLQDDRELDAGSYAEAVSVGGLSGVLGHGQNRFGEDRRESGDNLTTMGITRALSDARYGSLSIPEQAELISGLGRNYGGTYDFGGRMVGEAAQARMAGVGVGTSGQYYGMFAPGGGGVGDRDQASIVDMAKTMQGLGISSARMDQAIQTVAQNTTQMVNSGIKTDIPELTSLIAGASHNPGLSDLGARAANLGVVMQSGPMQARQTLMSAASGYQMALSFEEAASRAGGGGIGDIMGALDDMAKHPAELARMYRRRGDPTVMGLAYAGHGFTWDEAMAMQSDLRTGKAGGELLTTRSAGIAEGRTGGDGDWAEGLKYPARHRQAENMDHILGIDTYRAAEAFNQEMNTASGALRDFGGALHLIVDTISGSSDARFGPRSAAP